MKAELIKFLTDLSEIFPIPSTRNAETVIAEYTKYLLGECVNKQFDWWKLKRYIYDNYKKTFFPEIHILREFMPHGEIKKEIKLDDNEGDIVEVILPSGYKYFFTVSHLGRDAITSIRNKYGSCVVNRYSPKNYYVVGNEVRKYSQEEGEK